jgi:hypothetical protein
MSISRSRSNYHTHNFKQSIERFTGDLSVSERRLISLGLESASTGSSGIWNVSMFWRPMDPRQRCSNPDILMPRKARLHGMIEWEQ